MFIKRGFDARNLVKSASVAAWFQKVAHFGYIHAQFVFLESVMALFFKGERRLPK